MHRRQRVTTDNRSIEFTTVREAKECEILFESKGTGAVWLEGCETLSETE